MSADESPIFTELAVEWFRAQLDDMETADRGSDRG